MQEHLAFSTPLLLFSICNVLLFYAFPLLILQLNCAEASSSDCTNPVISSEVALFLFWCSITSSVPALLVVGLYGALTERYGPKLALIIPVTGKICNILSLLIASSSPFYRQYYQPIILFGSLTDGISGTSNSFLMAMFCHASETTSVDDRSLRFSVMEACLFSSSIIGPMILGLLLRSQDFTFVLWFTIGLCFATIYCISVLLSERPVSEKENEVEIFENPLATFKDMMKLFGFPSQLGNNTVPYISAAFFLYCTATFGKSTVEVLYQKSVFLWDSSLITFYGFLKGTIVVISMVFVPDMIDKWAGYALPDIHHLTLGLAAKGLHCALLGFVSSSFQMFAILPLLLLTGPVAPRARAFLSKAVGSHQTELFVAVAALESISALTSPLFTVLYSVSSLFFPGFTFEMIAFLFGVAMLLSLQGYLMIVGTGNYTNLDEQNEECKDLEGSAVGADWGIVGVVGVSS